MSSDYTETMKHQYDERPTKEEPHAPHHERHRAPCAHVPEFKRLNYFYGQMLGAQDFQAEQNYFREKLKLHNHCLHGYGVVCGLKIVPEPHDPSCESPRDKERERLRQHLEELKEKINYLEQQQSRDQNNPDPHVEEELEKLRAEAEDVERRLEEIGKESCDDEQPTRVWIECGLALDCAGNELVVRQPLKIDLWKMLSNDDRKKVGDGERTLYLSICYCEQGVDPVRPVLSDACGATPDCTYGKLRDAVQVKVTVDKPARDRRCETCCEPCPESCLLLARIANFRSGAQLSPADIYNEVRRRVSLYEFTTISGISWTHGADYSLDDAHQLLGTYDENGGLEIRFSRPVLISTLKRGVVDVWVIQGGGGSAGDIEHMQGEIIVDEPPDALTTRSFRYRYVGNDDPDPEDRILVIVRTAFILDECCRPVDGAHIGGRVPIIEGDKYKPFDRSKPFDGCASPPPGFGPWSSGSGTPVSSFESWFYIMTKSGSRTTAQQRRKDYEYES